MPALETTSSSARAEQVVHYRPGASAAHAPTGGEADTQFRGKMGLDSVQSLLNAVVDGKEGGKDDEN